MNSPSTPPFGQETSTVWAPQPSTLTPSIARPPFDPCSRDLISISILPEKEGLVFKHVNYQVESSTDSKVIRRYSDFSWLLEQLVKIHPFRLLPDLPPKKFNITTGEVAGSTDSLFIETRRRGLSRFINQISKHPILSKDPLVTAFLTVPTELSVWRRQTSIDSTDELIGKKANPSFIEEWNEDDEKQWKETHASVRRQYQQWQRMCILIERLEKRQQAIAADYARFSLALNAYPEDSNIIYSNDLTDVSQINTGITSFSKHLIKSKEQMESQSNIFNTKTLEDFKTYTDYINALKNLFDRLLIFGKNDISKLEENIKSANLNLNVLSKRPDVKGSELEKLKQQIVQGKKKISVQTNRDWLIKECIKEELNIFQDTQYLVSNLIQNWSANLFKFSELASDNWMKLVKDVEEIPNKRS